MITDIYLLNKVYFKNIVLHETEYEYLKLAHNLFEEWNI